MVSALAAMRAMLRRDLVGGLRSRGQVLMPLVFFAVVACVFPLALRPEGYLLQAVAPAVLWIAALLAAIMAAENMFKTDYANGSLDLLLLSPTPLALLVLTRLFAHWLTAGLPISLLAPLIGLMLGLDGPTAWALLFSFLLGTPILHLVAAIAAALLVGMDRGGALLTLMIMPLYVPVLVFGAGAAAAAAQGLPVSAPLYLLAALLVLSLTLAPPAVAAALRIGYD